MNKREIAPGIIVYKDVLYSYESIVNDIEEAVSASNGNIEWSPSYINIGKETKKDVNIRDTYSISVPYTSNSEENIRTYFENSLRDIFFQGFYNIEKDYMSTYRIDFNDHDAYQVLKYGVGQKFTNHIDDSPTNHRRVSSVYYLNEDYEGGEIVFPRFGITYKPAANEAILFPSTYVYNHSVSPVISGTRYAVVSWIK